MCNYCSCDFQDRCSIVGQMPWGFCCEKCDHYVEHHTCERLKAKVEEKTPKKALEVLQKEFGK